MGSPKHAFLDLFQVMFDMGPPISREVQLVSFHTVSKGYWGECGQRGGYFEMTNLPPKVFVIAVQHLSECHLSQVPLKSS